jgi:hypothetical protein
MVEKMVIWKGSFDRVKGRIQIVYWLPRLYYFLFDCTLQLFYNKRIYSKALKRFNNYINPSFGGHP